MPPQVDQMQALAPAVARFVARSRAILAFMAGTWTGMRRSRGSIERLPSGGYRVRVYAGTDPLTGKDHRLRETVPAGPHAVREAEKVRTRLLGQVDERRQPRTTATVRQLLERHLAEAALEPNTLSTYRGYVRKHVMPYLGRQYLHHNFIVAVLNDLFGIQARGGCSCAGPYGHRLLAIDDTESHAFRHEITQGCDGIKPGRARLNFNYFITDAVCEFLIDAVEIVAKDGHRPETGLWHHRDGSVEPPLRLTDVRFDGDGLFAAARPSQRAGEECFPQLLDSALELLAARPAQVEDGPGLSAEFEALRWFPLPAACLIGTARL